MVLPSPLGWVLLITCLLAVAAPQMVSAASGGPPKSEPAPFVQFDPNIPGVIDAMLESSFWADRIPNPDKVIMTPAEIERYNRRALRECEVLKDLRTFRMAIPGEEVRQMIGKVSTKPTKKRYSKGQELPASYFDDLLRNLALEAVPGVVEVRFGLTVRRTEMRAFPTNDQVFAEPDDYEFDRFMETALYPVEPVAILHTSGDGKWFLAQAYHYLAWVPVADVALVDRPALFRYLDAGHFLVVTGKQVLTTCNPIRPEISELQLDMGVRVPLAERREIPMEIDGQHPAGSYVIKLPVRDSEGACAWRLALVSRADDVRVGYLPLTRRNIITQAFKFLGQRYGWGGMFNTRDCSAFIMDNFRSMGILLPRNAGEQGKQAIGVKHEMVEGMTLEKRRQLFDRLPPATPVYMDGHAMLYLWTYEGDYFIIHDFAGFSVPGEDGKLKKSKTRVVFVTPLLGTFLSSGKPYLQGLYAAREFINK